MKASNKIRKEYLIGMTVFLLILLFFQAPATTYYISNSGFDTDFGTSPSSSWQTLDKVNTFLFQSGDSVLFKRGDVWRGQLIPQSGNSTGYIYYGAYSTGNNPEFLGSADMTNSNNWINKGNNIWSSAPASTIGGENILNPSFDIDAGNWIFYTQGNAMATGARDITDFTSFPASFKMDCASNGDNIYDIQFSTPNLSITYGKTYCLTFNAKCSSRFQLAGVLLMKQTTPYNLYFSNSVTPPVVDTSWATYTIHFTSAITANDGMIDFFFGDSLPDGSSFFIDDISFKEVAYNSSVTTDVGNIIFNNAASFGTKKWLLSDLQSQGDFWYDSDSMCVKLYSSINPGLFYSNIECALTKNIIDEQDKQYIIYENLALKYGSAHGIGGGNTSHIIIRSCDVSYIGGGGIFISPYGNVRYGNGIEFWGNAQHNLVEQCRVWQIYDAAITNQNTGSIATQSDIIYRNNLIYNAEWSFEYWNRPEGSTTQNIFFINNTCLYAGKTWAHLQRPDKRGHHLTFFQNDAATDQFYILNNIFFEATSACLYVIKPSYLDSMKLNNNCWYQTLNDTLIDIWWGFSFVNAYTMLQFSNYQNTYHQDTNSIAIYPIFADTVNGNYQILSNSPCLDSGTPDTSGIPVGSYDLIGNTRIQDGDGMAPSTIDIGCYEYEFITGFANQDYADKSPVKIYPNPATDKITIDLQEFNAFQNNTMSIYNIQGQKILHQTIMLEKTDIDISELTQGFYILKLYNNDRTEVVKIVKSS